MIIHIYALDYKTKIKWMYEKLMMSETCILYTKQSNDKKHCRFQGKSTSTVLIYKSKKIMLSVYKIQVLNAKIRIYNDLSKK